MLRNPLTWIKTRVADTGIALGGCYITVEESGSSRNPHALAVPTEFRKIAAIISDLCVRTMKVGAWSTYGFDHLMSWVVNDPNPTIPPWHTPPPVSASFFTLTVGGVNAKNHPSPGNLNSQVPGAVSDALSRIIHDPKITSNKFPNLSQKSQYWRYLGESMPASGTVPWWNYQLPSTPTDMTYECDDNLGSPTSADCTQIEWHQLGPFAGQPDTMTVRSGVTTFLHSNTCYLAISATMTLVLTWEQIRAAASALIGVCVQHPYQPSQGGRAYYGTQPQQSSRRRKRQAAVNGLNALPPGATLAVFAQREPWTTQAGELNSCTWHAVLNRHSVTTCSTS